MSLKNLCSCILFLFFCCVPAAELDIICTTDLHGHYEKMPAMAHLIKSFGNNTLKIDVGDTLTGTFLSTKHNGKDMIDLLNLLNFDVWVPGNHDFETGYNALHSRIRQFKGIVLGIQWHWQNIRPAAWKMFEINGVRAAVIGATDPAMPWRALPGTDAVFEDTTESISKILPEIKAAKPHVIILAYHNGEYSRYGSIYQLCSTFPEINLILGGHSHQEVWGKQVRHTFFVQAGAHASCVARIRIKVDDASGRLVKIESGVFYPDPAKIDQETAILCKRLKNKETVSGNAVAAATGKLYCLPVKKDKISPLGELGVNFLLKETGADAAIFSLPVVKQNVFQPRDRQGKFVINEKNLFAMFPFQNRICLIKLDRSDLKEFEMQLRDFSRKRKRRFFFAGVLSADKRGRLSSSKENFTLAVSDYILTAFPVMQRKLQSKNSWSLIRGLLERDMMRRALRSR